MVEDVRHFQAAAAVFDKTYIMIHLTEKYHNNLYLATS